MDVTPINEKSKVKSDSSKKFHLSSKQKKIWGSVFAVVLILIAFAGVYKYSYDKGYDKGYKAGEQAGKKSSTSSAKDLFNNIQNPFKTIVGTIEKVEGDKVTLSTSNGETKVIKLTDATKITKKTETLKRDSLTKGTKITVMTQGEGNDVSATRIVVR